MSEGLCEGLFSSSTIDEARLREKQYIFNVTRKLGARLQFEMVSLQFLWNNPLLALGGCFLI